MDRDSEIDVIAVGKSPVWIWEYETEGGRTVSVLMRSGIAIFSGSGLSTKDHDNIINKIISESEKGV
jgi:hypothetical protein